VRRVRAQCKGLPGERRRWREERLDSDLVGSCSGEPYGSPRPAVVVARRVRPRAHAAGRRSHLRIARAPSSRDAVEASGAPGAWHLRANFLTVDLGGETLAPAAFSDRRDGSDVMSDDLLWPRSARSRAGVGAADDERAFRRPVWQTPWGRQQTLPRLLRDLGVVQADVRGRAAAS
jgi:hypothetical protein